MVIVILGGNMSLKKIIRNTITGGTMLGLTATSAFGDSAAPPVASYPGNNVPTLEEFDKLMDYLHELPQPTICEGLQGDPLVDCVDARIENLMKLLI